MKEKHLRIALADDDAEDRLFFEEAFEELKIKSEVSTFNDGDVLMNFLNKEENNLPHLLFLDLNMPRKSGMECLAEIKANSRFKNIIIAIYSTSASEEDVENSFIKGANIYIKKPNDFQELKKTLSEVMTINWQYHTNALNRENFLLRL